MKWKLNNNIPCLIYCLHLIWSLPLSVLHPFYILTYPFLLLLPHIVFYIRNYWINNYFFAFFNSQSLPPNFWTLHTLLARSLQSVIQSHTTFAVAHILLPLHHLQSHCLIPTQLSFPSEFRHTSLEKPYTQSEPLLCSGCLAWASPPLVWNHVALSRWAERGRSSWKLIKSPDGHFILASALSQME